MAAGSTSICASAMAAGSCASYTLTSHEALRFTDDQIFQFMFRHGVLREVVRCVRCGNELQLNTNTLEFCCQRSVSVRRHKPKPCGFKLVNRKSAFFMTLNMVCLPCFVVPVALLFWRFLLWPLLRPLYIRWYNIPEEQAAEKNGTVEKLDKLGEDGCPFGCPIKPKNKDAVEVSPADEKKTL